MLPEISVQSSKRPAETTWIPVDFVRGNMQFSVYRYSCLAAGRPNVLGKLTPTAHADAPPLEKFWWDGVIVEARRDGGVRRVLLLGVMVVGTLL